MGDRRRLSSNPELPFEYAQWLSDGKTLVLTAENQRCPGFFDTRTNRFTELPIPLPEGTFFGKSTISPDETQVAYVRIEPKTTKVTQGETGGMPELDAYLHIMPVKGRRSETSGTNRISWRQPAMVARWSRDCVHQHQNRRAGNRGVETMCRVF